MISLLLICLLVAFTLLSGYFSLAQIALFSLSPSELKVYKVDPDPRKQLIVRLLSKPRELLVTILMYDITANILIQNTAAKLFGDYASWGLKVGLPLALTLLLGEVFPKTIALPNNARIAYKVAPSIQFLEKLLNPIRLFITTLTSHISQFLFFFLKREKEISKEELHHVLRRSESHGILSVEEAGLVDGYLSLSDYTVKERMRPRHEILYYDVEEPLKKLFYLFVEKNCSRVPVCKGDLQNMIGILSIKSFFLHRNIIEQESDVLKYLQKPFYVPETIDARSLLKQFFQYEQTMGIVVDEYGSICGLITQEDLFEIVVGEIEDLRDEKTPYTTTGDHVIITSGKFELAEFERLFGVLPPTESNIVTIGGWLTEQMGDIPKSGSQYIWNGFLFQVLAADPNRVRRVYIRKLEKDTPP